MAAPPPRTVSLYEQLREDIMVERLPPGGRISEVELGRRYNVSRTPVREALARLQQDGLLERRGSAVYVRLRTSDEIIDIYRVRVYLEGAIAFDAAHRRSATDILRLEAAAVRCSELTGHDSEQMQALNSAFHKELAEASHNQTLQDLQSRLTLQVAKLPSTTLNYPGRWAESVQQHLDLLEAIRRQDAEAAQHLAEAHMSAAAQIRTKLIAREFGEVD